MIVDVTVPSTTSSNTHLPPQLAKLGSGEIVLIELQGTLEIEGNESERNGKLVGKLVMGEKPTLMIGHHLLEGKIATLAKPLAVIHRASTIKDIPETVAMNVGLESETTRPTARWDMLAIVKKKIVFAKRPMPIVGSAGPKLKS